MKILRIFIYLFITLLVILVPIYGTARIILPNWLKNYVSSSLPPGSELLIGEMESTPNMGVLYKNLVFKNSESFLFPNKCPSCGSDTIKEFNNLTKKYDAVRRCKNDGYDCERIAVEKIKHFIS